MWKEYQKMDKFEKESRYSFLQDKRFDMKDEFSDRRDKRAHMDDEPNTNNSTFCLRQLYRAEDNDPDRYNRFMFVENNWLNKN